MRVRHRRCVHTDRVGGSWVAAVQTAKVRYATLSCVGSVKEIMTCSTLVIVTTSRLRRMNDILRDIRAPALLNAASTVASLLIVSDVIDERLIKYEAAPHKKMRDI